MRGDSILSDNDLIVFDPLVPSFYNYILGHYPNTHPWSPNQQVMVLEQEFMVAQNSYRPMPLNTPYNVAWSLGFWNTFPSGYPAASIGSLVLVDEGELRDCGGGISRLKRRWASLPPTRCEPEQFAATFVGLDTSGGGGTVSRQPFTQNVQSRLQYDYFIFDELDILSTPLFTGGGWRLNSVTGMYPEGIIIPAMQYFQSSSIATAYGVYIGNQTTTLFDDVTAPSLPSASESLNWAVGLTTSNGKPAEICAEASSFSRWMGNIFERRTRFILAQ